MKLIIWLGALLTCAIAAADVHPIVEMENGYLFGATADGKWIKPEETVKAIADNTTYRIYGLTQQLGEAKGSKPKAADDVCPDTLSVLLSQKPKGGVIGLAAPWNAAAAKAASQRYDSTSLCRCGARFFENKRDRPTESKD